jgi:hypothetical protein
LWERNHEWQPTPHVAQPRNGGKPAAWHDEAGLDLDDECLIDDWLRAAMYTDGQICLYRRAALDYARARLESRGQNQPSANVVSAG